MDDPLTHSHGPLLVRGGAGTGKTSLLVARFARLAADGVAPDRILFLAASPCAAAELRERVEDALPRAHEELHIGTVASFCSQLLHTEALEAGLDPFAVVLSAADRLAMLLERLDELTLRHHDFQGNAAGLVSSFVRRIDRLKDELVTAGEYGSWAAALPAPDEAARLHAAREREFAEIYLAHERMLVRAGALDSGDLLLRSVRLLRERPHVCARVAARFDHILVDELQDTSFAHGVLLRLLVADRGNVTAAGDIDASIHRFRGAAEKNFADLRAEWPSLDEVVLDESHRCPERIVAAARAATAGGAELSGGPGGEVAFWRCANERAQAQAVAADVERLVAREGVSPERVAVLVSSIRSEGRAVSVALEERAVTHRLVGAGAFLARAEVRDVLAWLRLLADPSDAGAVVRALARPPVGLSSVDLARVTQIARRRKLDMVAGLGAATESPQVPPEARDRIHAFLELHRPAAAAIDAERPDLFVHKLIERLGLRRQLLFVARTDVVEVLRNLNRVVELAAAYARREPQATARDFARHLAAVAETGLRDEDGAEGPAAAGVAVLELAATQGREWDHVYVLGMDAAAMPGPPPVELEPIPDELLREQVPAGGRVVHQARMRRLLGLAVSRAAERVVLAWPRASDRGAPRPSSPFVEDVRDALGAEWEDRAEELFGPDETLHSAYRTLRDELLESIARTGSRLGEMKLDTELDISHAVVRFLEVVKLAALIERGGAAGMADALPLINARLLSAVTSEQREILLTSALDDFLLGEETDALRRAAATAARAEPSLEAFLPRRGEGLVLSASDIETYRACPLRYKFARVFRIPAEPTIHQRFGIVVHQVLERFHAGGGSGSLSEILGLLDAAWRRAGFGDTEEERQLRVKATASLTRYQARLDGEDSEPVWFERSFAFRLGPHLLRGRVDRIDRLPDGGWELIDYKTGRPKSESQLSTDVQLSLYAVAAREAWELDGALGSYYYVLDDAKVRVPRPAGDEEWITDTVMEVADGIGAQGFEPTPSWSVCSFCDYRIACPAAER